MGKEPLSSPAPHNNHSNQRVWLIIVIVVLCLALACCILVVAGVLLLQPVWEEKTLTPEQQTVSFLPTTSAIPPSVPTETVNFGAPGILEYKADPLYGLASLQRGFSPDPHVVAVGAGGTIDTSSLNLQCGFTTSAPTVAFNLSGGASEGFLRIYFVPDDSLDTTLIVHTPNQEWLCKDNSSFGNGMDPVIDIEYAASGKYAIWVGMHQSDTYAPGRLFITESTNNTP